VTSTLDGAVGELNARDLTVHTDLLPAVITGVPVLLERMAGNLIDNAIAYNHAGGRIDIAIGRTDGQAVLRIRKTGAMLRPDTADRLLEPFVCGDGARLHTDTGAGLSIVQAIVTAHVGEISTTARPTGGLDITIRLPAGRQQLTANSPSRRLL
jgi:signal transduction histidine kinase